MLPILLASSSRYRRTLLATLGLNFEYVSPDIDESALPNESADSLVRRLSHAKAAALANTHPNTLIIGSDQVAVLDGEILNKPDTHEHAYAQLRAASGHSMLFKTGLCLLNTQTGHTQITVDDFYVQFRELNDQQIHHYLSIEKPYDCAGSFKAEGLGISLFTQFRGDDPNSLIGLPLMSLTNMLLNEGIDPLLAPHVTPQQTT